MRVHSRVQRETYPYQLISEHEHKHRPGDSGIINVYQITLIPCSAPALALGHSIYFFKTSSLQLYHSYTMAAPSHAPDDMHMDSDTETEPEVEEYVPEDPPQRSPTAKSRGKGVMMNTQMRTLAKQPKRLERAVAPVSKAKQPRQSNGRTKKMSAEQMLQEFDNLDLETTEITALRDVPNGLYIIIMGKIRVQRENGKYTKKGTQNLVLSLADPDNPETIYHCYMPT